MKTLLEIIETITEVEKLVTFFGSIIILTIIVAVSYNEYRFEQSIEYNCLEGKPIAIKKAVYKCEEVK